MNAPPTRDTKPPADTRPCNACGYPGPHVEGDPKPPHGNRRLCGSCGNFMGWVAKDHLKRSDHNRKHRYDWRKRHDGQMRCHWCLVFESETSAAGSRRRAAWCSHALRHMMVRFQRHMRGSSDAKGQAA